MPSTRLAAALQRPRLTPGVLVTTSSSVELTGKRDADDTVHSVTQRFFEPHFYRAP